LPAPGGPVGRMRVRIAMVALNPMFSLRFTYKPIPIRVVARSMYSLLIDVPSFFACVKGKHLD